MGDPDYKDSKAFIVDLSNNPVGSDTVSPEVAKPCSTHGKAKLARILHPGQS